MGAYVQNPNPNAFVRTMRKLYNNVLQFKKGYVKAKPGVQHLRYRRRS